MALANILLDNIVSISSFGRGQSSKNFEKAKVAPVIVVKNNVPEAVIVTLDEYARLIDIEEDYLLLNEAMKRIERDKGDTVSQEQILKQLGISSIDIASADDVELE